MISLRPNRTQRRRSRRAPAPSVSSLVSSIDRGTQAQAVMLDWFGQQPLSFHRCFADVTGSVVAALWLSFVTERMATVGPDSIDDKGDFEFAMSAKECEQDTGITRAQQNTCRRLLVAQGLLSEVSRRGKVVRYRIHLAQLMRALTQRALPLAQVLSWQLQRGNRPEPVVASQPNA